MEDRVAIVTGPTSGIGKEIAAQLAGLGAEVVLACRNLHKGEMTLEEIAGRTGSKKLSVMEVDTSSQSSIRRFAQRVKSTHSRVDVLMNNAGVSLRTKRTSVDGIELVFATNVLGYHLLTRELHDVLVASAPARIVNVASTFAGNFDLDDLQFERRRFHEIKVYQQTKACNRLLTWALSRRLEGTGVTVNAMAPGLVQTNLYRETPLPLKLLLRVVGIFGGRSVQVAADTAVWLASSNEVEGLSGRFFELRKEIPCQFRDREAEERLWAECERLAPPSPAPADEGSRSAS